MRTRTIPPDIMMRRDSMMISVLFCESSVLAKDDFGRISPCVEPRVAKAKSSRRKSRSVEEVWRHIRFREAQDMRKERES